MKDRYLAIKGIALLILIVSQIYFLKVRIHERHRYDTYKKYVNEFRIANEHKDLDGMEKAYSKMEIELQRALTNK